MSVVARRIRSTPQRDSVETWSVIVDLLAPEDTDSRRELLSIEGIAAATISTESPRKSPMVMKGSGPRIRIYCLYDDESISADSASENALAQCPTDGDWELSLPVNSEDLAWVSAALLNKSSRVKARDKSESLESESTTDQQQSRSTDAKINLEAFFRS